MKRLLLLLPLLFIAGCGKYGSMVEARAACRSWAYKGAEIQQARSAEDEVSTISVRGCDNEEATKQVLGYEWPTAQAGTTYIGDDKWIGTTYTNENRHVIRRQVITKRFKY